MAGTQQATLSGASHDLENDQDDRLTLPEATMFIVASSGALWALLFGIANLLVG